MKNVALLLFFISFQLLSMEMQTPKAYLNEPIPVELFDEQIPEAVHEQVDLAYMMGNGSESESSNHENKKKRVKKNKNYCAVPSPRDEALQIKDYILTKLLITELPESIEQKLVAKIEKLMLKSPKNYDLLKQEASIEEPFRSFFEEVFVNEKAKMVSQRLVRKTLNEYMQDEHTAHIKKLHFQRNLALGFSICESFFTIATLIATIPPAIIFCDK